MTEAVSEAAAGPRLQTQAEWLQGLEQRRSQGERLFLLGCTGHLMLNRREERIATERLVLEVLPAAVAAAGGARILLASGGAPGADVLFLDVARRWMQDRGHAHECIAILPVPVSDLLQDWVAKSESDGHPVSAEGRARIGAELDETLATCHDHVRMYESLPSNRRIAPSQRTRQYRRLAALLALRCDALVGILRPQAARGAGGAIEVIAWRQDPQTIPSDLRQGHPPPAPGERPLWRIDLTQDAPLPIGARPVAKGAVVEVERAAQAAYAAGNDLLCNDLVHRAHQRGLSSPGLDYLRILSLANIGSVELARRQYDALAPPPAQRDQRWITLLGRLEKDLAYVAGQDARGHFLASADAYIEAFERYATSYAAINAATLLVLSGDPALGKRMAQEALRRTRQEPTPTAVDRFYRHATEAEAYLVLGDLVAAQRCLADADRWLPHDRARRGRTRNQLEHLCRALDYDPAVLDALPLPPVVMLRRMGPLTPRAVDGLDLAEVESIPLDAVVFARICDPFDLCVVERLIARGNKVQLGLAFRAERVREHCREQLGGEWPQRMDDCVSGTQLLASGRGFLEVEQEWAAAQLTQQLLGLALLDADRHGSLYRMVELRRDGQHARLRSLMPLQPNAERTRIARLQLEQAQAEPEAPEGRRMVGLLFADFAGFSRLDDPDLPMFVNSIMSGISDILDRYGERVFLRRTWGDALHVVTDDAVTAADVAADIQDFIAAGKAAREGMLATLELRMSAHYGPVFAGPDPVMKRDTFFGTQLNFTARIEPVTPPGTTYVTEALAARLSLQAPGRFNLEYAGEIELAKRFGAYRLYALHRLMN